MQRSREVKCARCGTVLEGKYCGGCGAPAEPALACADCGAQREAADRFCGHCGAKQPEAKKPEAKQPKPKTPDRAVSADPVPQRTSRRISVVEEVRPAPAAKTSARPRSRRETRDRARRVRRHRATQRAPTHRRVGPPATVPWIFGLSVLHILTCLSLGFTIGGGPLVDEAPVLRYLGIGFFGGAAAALVCVMGIGQGRRVAWLAGMLSCVIGFLSLATAIPIFVLLRTRSTREWIDSEGGRRSGRYR